MWRLRYKGRNEEEEDARDMRYADVQGVFIKATQIIVIVMGNLWV